MDLEITEPGLDLPVILAGQGGIELSSHYGKGSFQCYQGKGFSFWDNNYQFSSETVLHARANIPVLELHITRTGIWQGSWDGVDGLDLYPGQFNLTYTPHVMTTAVFKKKASYRSCDIHFDFSYLESLAPDFPSLNEFLLAVTRKHAISVSPRNHACTREMIAAVESILHNPFGPATQPYILQTKVREILLLALEKIAADLKKPLPVITRQQQEKVFHAKEAIENAGEVLPSLEELGRLIGLNECTLKRGFKLLYGVTPYDHYIKTKMEKAKLLLLNSNDSVATIAYLLGYSQPSSFGHEFKKAVRMTPGEFRKLNFR